MGVVFYIFAWMIADITAAQLATKPIHFIAVGFSTVLFLFGLILRSKENN